MSSLVGLFLVVAAIYLIECVVWARRDCVAFQTFVGRQWHLIRPHAVNERHGVVAANPLPPLGTLVLCEPWPVSISPDGVAGGDAEMAWDGIRVVSATSGRLLIGDRVVAKLGSARLAGHLAGLVDGLRAQPPEKRARVVAEAVERSLDIDEIERRLAELRSRSKALRWACNLLFLFVFAVTPGLVAARGLQGSWPLVVAGCLTLALLVLACFYRAHRSLYPADRGDRLNHMVMIALSPPAAIRALDLLWRDALALHHPLAVAQVLCPRRTFVELARSVILDLEYRPCAGPTEEWFRARLRSAIEDRARRAGVDLDDLVRPPLREGPHSRSYCPRCRCQYVRIEGGCSDCAGLALEPFPDEMMKGGTE